MARTDAPRTTPHGLSVTRDDGQNVGVAELLPCPFCGATGGRGPYVQVGPEWGDRSYDARVVCSRCHVSTIRETASGTELAATGEDVTRDLAVEAAVERWNRRAGDRP